jgi:hypothetical protein
LPSRRPTIHLLLVALKGVITAGDHHDVRIC